MTNKTRGFTLIELLVAVIIIGVLSAVALPKFSKVLETRKTTEAENIMAAVRNEQEARCALGKDYTIDRTQLASLPKQVSRYYDYKLDGQGIKADSKGSNYSLQIPSYTDGRICCSGAGCENLNKDYPSCESMNYERAMCNVETCSDEHTEGEIASSAECACGGARYERYRCTGSGQWETYLDLSSCVPCEEDVSCNLKEKPFAQSKQCEACGETITQEVYCELDTWKTRWPECKDASECVKEEEKVCEAGARKDEYCECGMLKFKVCNAAGDGWEDGEDPEASCDLTQDEIATCACEPKPEDDLRECPLSYDGRPFHFSHGGTSWVCLDGKWTKETRVCDCRPFQVADNANDYGVYFYDFNEDTWSCDEKCLYYLELETPTKGVKQTRCMQGKAYIIIRKINGFSRGTMNDYMLQAIRGSGLPLCDGEDTIKYRSYGWGCGATPIPPRWGTRNSECYRVVQMGDYQIVPWGGDYHGMEDGWEIISDDVTANEYRNWRLGNWHYITAINLDAIVEGDQVIVLMLYRFRCGKTTDPTWSDKTWYEENLEDIFNPNFDPHPDW